MFDTNPLSMQCTKKGKKIYGLLSSLNRIRSSKCCTSAITCKKTNRPWQIMLHQASGTGWFPLPRDICHASQTSGSFLLHARTSQRKGDEFFSEAVDAKYPRGYFKPHTRHSQSKEKLSIRLAKSTWRPIVRNGQEVLHACGRCDWKEVFRLRHLRRQPAVGWWSLLC